MNIIMNHHLETAERLFKENQGKFPSSSWLKDNHIAMYRYMVNHPEEFKKFRESQEKPFSRLPDHLETAKRLSKENQGRLPSSAWLIKNHYPLYKSMIRYPEEFKEIREDQEDHLETAKRVSAQKMYHDANQTKNVVQVMQAHHHDLLAQRDCLLVELAILDDKIFGYTKAMKAIGAIGTPAAKRRGRPVGSGLRQGTLKDYIQRVLEKATEPLSPKEITELVVKAGYETSSKNLRMSVSNALAKMENLKHLRHGEYQMG